MTLAPAFVRVQLEPRDRTIITPSALAFLAKLHRRFEHRRRALLHARALRQTKLDAGQKPTFLASTKHIRDDLSWHGPPIPPALADRRVEITGPPQRKMVINALQCGAKVFMADFEDSSSPTWRNTVDGQQNLYDAVRGTITFTDPKSSKEYAIDPNKAVATLMVRPRGWHLTEAHIAVDGQCMSASLVDFGLFFFHNAVEQLAHGKGPYFYLPKLESHLEARLWNDVFVFSQQCLNLPNGTIRATVLIETILAAFEMEEIIYELREHSAGLNCGRWDYIFSVIKRFKLDPALVLPNRSLVGMDAPFMDAYTKLLVKTCHARGVHAMGGMAAQIPIKNDPAANDAVLRKIAADKLREVNNGHDGSWVAHPALVKVAEAIFDKHMPAPNQINRKFPNRVITADQLLDTGRAAMPAGSSGVTLAGVRNNITCGLIYLEAWLQGNGCVPVNHKMEDLATVEISRAQLWSWLKHGVKTDDSEDVVTEALVRQMLAEEVAKLKRSSGGEGVYFDNRRFTLAVALYEKALFNSEFIEFLSLPAYWYIVSPCIARLHACL